MVTARLLFRSRFAYDDGAVREIVIWQVPKDRDRPQGLKYRFTTNTRVANSRCATTTNVGKETTGM